MRLLLDFFLKVLFSFSERLFFSLGSPGPPCFRGVEGYGRFLRGDVATPAGATSVFSATLDPGLTSSPFRVRATRNLRRLQFFSRTKLAGVPYKHTPPPLDTVMYCFLVGGLSAFSFSFPTPVSRLSRILTNGVRFAAVLRGIVSLSFCVFYPSRLTSRKASGV